MQVPIRLAALTAFAALALTGCGMDGGPGDDPTTDAPTAADPVFEGRWVAEDPEDAYLEFTEVDDGGGTMSGSDGCNGLQGEFFIDGDTAEVDRGPGTLKACPGVDTWLNGVTAVVVDGDTMTVQDDEGEELGVLTRDEGGDATPTPTGSSDATIDEADEQDDSDS